MGKNFNLEQIMPKKGSRLILLLGNCINSNVSSDARGLSFSADFRNGP